MKLPFLAILGTLLLTGAILGRKLLRKPTEKEKYFARINRLKKKEGLLSVHVTTQKGLDNATAILAGEPLPHGKPTAEEEEEYYGELNRMLDAPDLPDPEVLGKYSL